MTEEQQEQSGQDDSNWITRWHNARDEFSGRARKRNRESRDPRSEEQKAIDNRLKEKIKLLTAIIENGQIDLLRGATGDDLPPENNDAAKGIETVLAFSNGARITKFKAQALNPDAPLSDTEEFYSLHNEHDQPLATIKVGERKKLLQCVWMQDDPEQTAQYLPVLEAFMTHLGFKAAPEARFWGMVQDVNGYCYSMQNLPENLTVVGSLYVVNEQNLTMLPEGLFVTGSLSITGCTALTTLPKNLRVKQNLLLISCPDLSSIPATASIGNCLYIEGCGNLQKLPRTLAVGGEVSFDKVTYPRVVDAADALLARQGAPKPPQNTPPAPQ